MDSEAIRLICGAVFFALVWLASVWFRRIVNPEPTYHRVGKSWETNYPGEGKVTRHTVVNNGDPDDVQEILE